MNSILTKIAHTLKRHPLLYLVRYVLLSKNSKAKDVDDLGCFNDYNSLDTVPKLYFELNAKIAVDPNLDQLEKAIAIGSYLRKVIPGGPGIGRSSEKTLQMMLAGTGGVCSDFSQIFNLFCLINNIRVKEWGVVDCFYKTKFGHSFSEIYSSKRQKWIAIDTHKGILFQDEVSGDYLSVMELFSGLRNGKTLHTYRYSDYIEPDTDRTKMVYSHFTIPFIVHQKDSAVADSYYDRFPKRTPIILINTLLVLLGKSQTFLFVMDNYRVKLLPRFLQNLFLPARAQ